MIKQKRQLKVTMLVEIDTILKPPPPPPLGEFNPELFGYIMPLFVSETSYFEEILFTHIFLCALIPVVLVLRLVSRSHWPKNYLLHIKVYSFFFPRQMVIRRPLSPAIVEVEYVVFPRREHLSLFSQILSLSSDVNVFHGPHQMISTEWTPS